MNKMENRTILWLLILTSVLVSQVNTESMRSSSNQDGFQNKYIPSFSWGQSEKVGLNRFINSSKKAMSRRDCVMSETLKQKIIELYQR